MRTLRLITIIVTLLSLPAYGLGTVGDARACPAKSHAAGIAIEHDMATGDCCAEKDGKKIPCESPESDGACGSCTTAHGCKNPSSFESVGFSGISIVPSKQLPIEDSLVLALSESPHGLFRPPALI